MKTLASKVNDQKIFFELMRKRDIRGIEFMYDRYAGVLYGLICRIVSEQEPAEEALIKTFRNIWDNFKEYDPASQNICIWMINIARQEAFKIISENKISGSRVIVDEPRTGNENSRPAHLTAKEIPVMNTETDHKIAEMVFFSNQSVIKIADLAGIKPEEVKKKFRLAINHSVNSPLKKNIYE